MRRLFAGAGASGWSRLRHCHPSAAISRLRYRSAGQQGHRLMHPLRRRSRIVSRQRFLCRLFSPLPPPRRSVAEFYTGKTVTISVGFSPGGSYDFYPRVFARYMGKYIPGNPNVVVQNMPGAGLPARRQFPVQRRAQGRHRARRRDADRDARSAARHAGREVQRGRVHLCRPHDRRAGDDDQLARSAGEEHRGGAQIRD